MTQCPVCKEMTLSEVEAENSLSRRDNHTFICNDCGSMEAMQDLLFGGKA